MHTVLYDTNEYPVQQFQIFEGLPLFLKLKLEKKKPPVTIYFKDIETGSHKVLDAYWSMDVKEPGDNEDHMIGVSKPLQ